MNIPSIKLRPQPSFKAHFYDCKLKNENLRVNSIITDNAQHLGNNPEIVITDGCGYKDFHFVDIKDAKPIQMQKAEDGNFIAKIHSFLEGYKILYKDTGLVDDNNGKNYDLSADTIDKLTNKAIISSKIAHNHPLTSIISAGEVKGR